MAVIRSEVATSFHLNTKMGSPTCIFIICGYYYRDNILHYTYTLQTKGLILQYKFYGSSTDDPVRDRSARALARIKVRLSLPYTRQVYVFLSCYYYVHVCNPMWQCSFCVGNN